MKLADKSQCHRKDTTAVFPLQGPAEFLKIAVESPIINTVWCVNWRTPRQGPLPPSTSSKLLGAVATEIQVTPPPTNRGLCYKACTTMGIQVGGGPRTPRKRMLRLSWDSLKALVGASNDSVQPCWRQ